MSSGLGRHGGRLPRMDTSSPIVISIGRMREFFIPPRLADVLGPMPVETLQGDLTGLPCLFGNLSPVLDSCCSQLHAGGRVLIERIEIDGHESVMLFELAHPLNGRETEITRRVSSRV